MAPRVAAGETVAILFGRERNGLENDEVALADCIVTLPVNPAFASLNLAQAVIIVAYEWFKASSGALPFSTPRNSAPAKQQLFLSLPRSNANSKRSSFFGRLTSAKPCRSICAIFSRAWRPTQQDIQTLHGVVMSIAEGRKGPARGGVLDGEEAEMLRTLLAERGSGDVPGERGPVRGLSRLLRRNPTEAERALWHALTNDRRFAGRGFKRQTPIGQHICDFVSFPLKDGPRSFRPTKARRPQRAERASGTRGFANAGTASIRPSRRSRKLTADLPAIARYGWRGRCSP